MIDTGVHLAIEPSLMTLSNRVQKRKRRTGKNIKTEKIKIPKRRKRKKIKIESVTKNLDLRLKGLLGLPQQHRHSPIKV